jgi:hypothetical protein
MPKITNFLKRLLGRIERMSLLREMLLIALVPCILFAYKFYDDLQSLSKAKDFNTLAQNTPFDFVIVLPYLGLLIILVGVWWIDHRDSKKQDKRHEDLLEVINGLTKEIRKDREDRNKINSNLP